MAEFFPADAANYLRCDVGYFGVRNNLLLPRRIDMNRKKPTGIMQQGHYFHLKERAEQIFGPRLVSVKMYNRFIEVKFQVELDREYRMNYLWCNVVAVDREQITIYIHNWLGGMDDAMRQFNPFYM